jgi:hypothetical protein
MTFFEFIKKSATSSKGSFFYLKIRDHYFKETQVAAQLILCLF